MKVPQDGSNYQQHRTDLPLTLKNNYIGLDIYQPSTEWESVRGPF